VKDTRRLASGPGYVPHDRSIFATVWTHHSAHHSAHQPFSAFLFCTLTPRGAGRSAVKHGEPRDLASDTMDGRALFLCYPPPGCDMVHTLPLTHTLHRRAATWYTPCPSPTPSTAGLRHGTHPAPHPHPPPPGCDMVHTLPLTHAGGHAGAHRQGIRKSSVVWNRQGNML
jgi:hypothetical protein